MRADGFARQPIVRMTNVNLEPGEAGTLDDLIADTERRPADRDQPLVVDRRPPAPLPVRGRGGLGDPRRRARAAAAQPELRGRDAAVLGGCDAICSASEWRLHGAARLRQGRARPVRCTSRTARRRRASATCRWASLERRSSWPSAPLAAARGRRRARPVVHERSLLLRFAANRPTQATAVDDLTVEVAVVRDGHVGQRRHQRHRRRRRSRACARRAAAAAEAAARTAAPAPSPASPAARRARAHQGHDAATAALDPAPGGAALATAFAARRPAASRRTGSGPPARTSVRVATSARRRAPTDRTTDAFMKVICIAPGGRSGYAGAAAWPRRRSTRRRSRARRRRKARARRARPRSPPGELPGRARGRARSASCSSCSAALAFNGLAYAEGRSALAGRLGERVAAPAINLSDSPRFAAHAAARVRRRGHAEGAGAADPGRRGARRRARPAQRGAPAAARGRPATPSRRAATPRARARRNLVLIGGGAARRGGAGAPVERGVYVTRLWYANLVRPKETLITGVTRDGTFLIEDGRITRPLARPAPDRHACSGSCSSAQALGARQGWSSEGEFYGAALRDGVVCPPLRRRRALHRLAGDSSDLEQHDHVHHEQRSRTPIVQRFRLRSTSEPPPNGPAPVPTPKAPESPASLPECMSMSRSGRPR